MGVCAVCTSDGATIVVQGQKDEQGDSRSRIFLFSFHNRAWHTDFNENHLWVPIISRSLNGRSGKMSSRWPLRILRSCCRLNIEDIFSPTHSMPSYGPGREGGLIKILYIYVEFKFFWPCQLIQYQMIGKLREKDIEIITFVVVQAGDWPSHAKRCRVSVCHWWKQYVDSTLWNSRIVEPRSNCIALAQVLRMPGP